MKYKKTIAFALLTELCLFLLCMTPPLFFGPATLWKAITFAAGCMLIVHTIAGAVFCLSQTAEAFRTKE